MADGCGVGGGYGGGAFADALPPLVTREASAGLASSAAAVATAPPVGVPVPVMALPPLDPSAAATAAAAAATAAAATAAATAASDPGGGIVGGVPRLLGSYDGWSPMVPSLSALPSPSLLPSPSTLLSLPGLSQIPLPGGGHPPSLAGVGGAGGGGATGGDVSLSRLFSAPLMPDASVGGPPLPPGRRDGLDGQAAGGGRGGPGLAAPSGLVDGGGGGAAAGGCGGSLGGSGGVAGGLAAPGVPPASLPLLDVRAPLMRSTPAAAPSEAMMLPSVVHGFSPLVRAAAAYSSPSPGFLIDGVLAGAPPPPLADGGGGGAGMGPAESMFSSSAATAAAAAAAAAEDERLPGKPLLHRGADGAVLDGVEDDEADQVQRAVEDVWRSAAAGGDGGGGVRDDALVSVADLRRVTGLRRVVFDSIRGRVSCLPPASQRALLLLSVFPRTFDLDAATSVLASRIAPREVLAPLLGAQLLTSVDDRLELNAVAKLFVTEETLPIKNLTLTDADAATVAARELGDPPPTDLTQSLVAAGRARFVSYFQSVLRSLDDESIHKLGWARERAMAVYDVERDNMDAAAQIARASASEKPLRQFLTAGASIMRYCVPAFSRVDYLCKAVEATDAASTSPPTKLDAGGGRGGRGGVDAGGDTSMLPPISPHSAAAAKTERVAEATAAVAQVVAAHKAAAVATEAAAAAAEAAAAADATGGPVGDRLLPLDGAAAAARRQREEAEIERARVAAAAAMAAGDGGGGSAMGGGEAAIPAGVCPELRSKARLHLALGEAHCDTLNVEAAEEPLQRAMELMGEVSPARSCLPELIDSVLVLLLVASIRMQATPPRTREARALLVRALRVLTAAGLGKTTLAVNAMTNLTQIHLRRGELLKARSVVSQLLDVLDTMRYSKMPIYADALGSQAMVSLALGDAPAAERQFSAALEVVAEWGTKTWGSLPVQHCLDLDLWLLEGLARAMRVQGRVEDAAYVTQKAREGRVSRQLGPPGRSAGGEAGRGAAAAVPPGPPTTVAAAAAAAASAAPACGRPTAEYGGAEYTQLRHIY